MRKSNVCHFEVAHDMTADEESKQDEVDREGCQHGREPAIGDVGIFHPRHCNMRGVHDVLD